MSDLDACLMNLLVLGDDLIVVAMGSSCFLGCLAKSAGHKRVGVCVSLLGTSHIRGVPFPALCTSTFSAELVLSFEYIGLCMPQAS